MMKLAVTLAALVGAAHGQDCAANEPDLTDANMEAIAADACDGTALDAACTSTCSAGYTGGSVTCATGGTFTVVACVENHPECGRMIPGLLALSGCGSDEASCGDCHVDAVNTILCPNTVNCCTTGGVEQAAGDTNVGDTVPTVCATTAQAADAACANDATDGTVCRHFGHPGVCQTQQCVDVSDCSDVKKAHLALCATDCTTCTAAEFLGGCLVDGVSQSYGATFCGTGKCSGNLDAANDVTCPAGSALKADAWSITGTDAAACCDENTCTAAVATPAGYAVAGAADGTTVTALGAVSCATGFVAEDAAGAATTPAATCDGTDFVYAGCLAKGTCNTAPVSCTTSNLASYNTAACAADPCVTDEAACCTPPVQDCVEATAATSTCTACGTELYTLTTAASGGGTACAGASTLCADGDGATDALITCGKCTGNTAAAGDVVCGTGQTAKADSATIDGTDAAACCDTTPTAPGPTPDTAAGSGAAVAAVAASGLALAAFVHC